MNPYIRRNTDILPLLAHCSGSETEETGIIAHILSGLGPFSPFAVEFGQRILGGGTVGDTARDFGFSLLNIDAEASSDGERMHPWNDGRVWTLFKRRICPLNLNTLFDEGGVPQDPAVAVIDIDGMDYWCMLALLGRRRPALLIVEYNCHVPFGMSASLAFNRGHAYRRNTDYGASLRALTDLAAAHGYLPVHIHGPLNLYFVDAGKVRDPGLKELSSRIAGLSADEFARASDTALFYDSFFGGKRPSWFGTPPPDTGKAPWIRLDRIGGETQRICIGDIGLEVFRSDQGGDHYRQRGHKEDGVSPLWSLIRDRLTPEVLIDIGANYGYTTSLLAKRLGVRRVVAVEPDPRLAAILRSNLRENIPAIEITVAEACVSSNPDCVSAIGINPWSTQDNRLLAQKDWQEAVVRSITLADILSEVGREQALFIKCDTQGYDLDVLASGREQLAGRDNWMMRFEFAPMWIENQGFVPAERLADLCGSFDLFEGPLRTPWNAGFGDLFSRPLRAEEAEAFVAYVRELNHKGTGWLDLYILPRGAPFRL